MSLFVTIEGIEGSGKSTLAAEVRKLLTAEGHAVIVTREPGATGLGKAIRSLLLDNKEDSSSAQLEPKAELLLFAADRAQHVAELLRPSLEAGKIVICDRYIHSTYAYQGYGRGIDLDVLRKLNQIATDGLTPDLVILMDLPADAGIARAAGRSRSEKGVPDRIERLSIDFHRKVRDGFIALSKEAGSNFIVLDATNPPGELAQAGFEAIKRAIASRAKQ